jgi:hypothetical protein
MVVAPGSGLPDLSVSFAAAGPFAVAGAVRVVRHCSVEARIIVEAVGAVTGLRAALVVGAVFEK